MGSEVNLIFRLEKLLACARRAMRRSATKPRINLAWKRSVLSAHLASTISKGSTGNVRCSLCSRLRIFGRTSAMQLPEIIVEAMIMRPHRYGSLANKFRTCLAKVQPR